MQADDAALVIWQFGLGRGLVEERVLPAFFEGCGYGGWFKGGKALNAAEGGGTSSLLGPLSVP